MHTNLSKILLDVPLLGLVLNKDPFEEGCPTIVALEPRIPYLMVEQHPSPGNGLAFGGVVIACIGHVRTLPVEEGRPYVD